MDWQEIFGNWVLIPRRVQGRPRGIIHFLGGAFIAAAPHLTYRWLLEELAAAGYVIIATPFVNTFDHSAIAEDVLFRFDRGLRQLSDRSGLPLGLPIYGIGHSMGCKVHLLISSEFEAVERAGNILIAFNNFEAKRSIPFLDQAIASLAPVLSPVVNLDVEFTPTPAQTLKLVEDFYGVPYNLLIRFRTDELDQTRSLLGVLEAKFPNTTSLQRLPGNHLTPLGQDVRWQAGKDFSALDAMGQWMKQEFYRDLNRLKQEILSWLELTEKP